MIIEETWLSVPEWPEYEVSNLGRVKRVGAKKGARVGMILKPVIKRGYHQITLIGVGKKRYCGVHRLVCLAFNGNPPIEKPLATHRDGSRNNNVPSNLRWGSRKDNAQDCINHGRKPIGSKAGGAKLNEDAVAIIRGISRCTRKIREALAERYGVSPETVRSARFKGWFHVPKQYHNRPRRSPAEISAAVSRQRHADESAEAKKTLT